jgi:OOP family OmpA-OmpF porin
MKSHVVPAACCAMLAAALLPPPASAGPAASNQVVVAGSVPDDATRQAVMARLRALYGADAVTDRIAVEPGAAVPEWSRVVQGLIGPDIARIRAGQLDVDGTSIVVRGEVSSTAARDQIAASLSRGVPAGYTVTQQLRVRNDAKALRERIDAALVDRIVAFEAASARLTPQGRDTLDHVAPLLGDLPAGMRVEIIGHTDAQGRPADNLVLSSARAEAVRAYLVEQGVDGTRLATSGRGAAEPVATNGTAAGRALNRRIEVRVSP